VATFIADRDILYNGLDEEIKAHFYANVKTQSAALVSPLDVSYHFLLMRYVRVKIFPYPHYSSRLLRHP
jgi:hypothetical protein